MGTSHFQSDIRGFDGTETIRAFSVISASSLVGPVTGNTAGVHTGAVVGDVTGNLNGNIVASPANYIRFGDMIIMSGGLNVEASICTALNSVASSYGGSLYSNTDGSALWYADGNSSATRVSLY